MAHLERRRERLDVHGKILADIGVGTLTSGPRGALFFTHGTAAQSGGKSRTNREIMFETFNVPGVHVGVQAVLALHASVALHGVDNNKKSSDVDGGSNKNDGGGLTGTVIDIGDGVTHVIPVCDGYVVNSAIKSVPLAGRDLTRFVQTLMRERGENVPAEEFSRVAQKVKEKYCYVSKDIAKEFEMHERNPKEYVIRMEGIRAKTVALASGRGVREIFSARSVFPTGYDCRERERVRAVLVARISR